MVDGALRIAREDSASTPALRSVIQYFRAPWGLELRVVTAVFGVLLLVALAQGGYQTALGLLVIALVAAAFSVRGYSVSDGTLTVHRPGWVNRFNLNRLLTAEVLENGLPGSLRMLGVGGLFAFVGYFWHPDRGWYRAYATDPSKAVLLNFEDMSILVTPDSPREFAVAVWMHSRYQPP